MPMQSIIPEEIWTKARTDYITSNISYADVTRKYGIPKSTLFKRASREEWVKKRKICGREVEKKTISKISSKKAQQIADKLLPLQRTADALTAACEAVMRDSEQFNRHIITEGIGPGMTETSERVLSKVDTKALRDMTSALKDLTSVVRNLYNIPTDAEREAREIAAARLQMDKAKVEKETDEGTSVIKIEFEGEDYGE